MLWIQLVVVDSHVTMECGLNDHIVQVCHFFESSTLISFQKIETGRCSLPTLQTFLNDTSATNGLDISSQLLTSNPGASDEILIGSYISFNCKNGYKNTDGNLNVTCNANGQWSAFPVCTSTSEYSGNILSFIMTFMS
jgi:hypothetical protein